MSLQQFGELVGSLAPALMEAHFLVRSAIGGAPVQYPGAVAGPSAIFFEGDRCSHEGFLGRNPGFGERVGDDELLFSTTSR